MTNGEAVTPEFSGRADRLPTALSRWFSELTDRGIVATDRDLRVIVWNRWMEVHTGLPAADVIGRSLLDLYPDLVTRGVDQYYREALAGRISVISHGLHRHVLGVPPTNPDLGFTEMPQSGRIGPLSEDEVVVGTVTTLEDISDRLASEAELRKQIQVQQMARVTAEKALRAKDEFLSTVSHEIRNPLNAVLGWSRILLDRKDVDAETLARALEVINRNATAQARMIDDLLDVARIASGKLRLVMQSVDMLAVTLAAIDMIAPSAKAKEIHIRTNLDPKAPPVLGDPQRLQQVAWNLLSNAVKFTDEEGTIDVSVEPAGKMIRLVVRDSGHGIRPEFLPYVFERFRQGDSSSTKRFGGLGLGLALVRELVELHGGTVKAESEGAGKGATFVVTLPVTVLQQARQLEVENSTPADVPSVAGLRVLVVEDQTDSRELLVEMLSRWGAEVTAVPSCEEALACLMTPGSFPQVIVSDLGMQKEDGYDLIRQIRALPWELGGQIPAVAVTGYANPDDLARALSAGYQSHVSKPIDPVRIAAAIAQAARHARLP